MSATINWAEQNVALPRARKLPVANPGQKRDILSQVLVYLSPPGKYRDRAEISVSIASFHITSIHYSSYNERYTAWPTNSVVK